MGKLAQESIHHLGIKCFSLCSRRYCRASGLSRPCGRDGRLFSASHTSTIANILAAKGICSPFRPRGNPCHPTSRGGSRNIQGVFQIGNRMEHIVSELRVLLHDQPFFIGQVIGLEQDVIRHTQLPISCRRAPRRMWAISSSLSCMAFANWTAIPVTRWVWPLGLLIGAGPWPATKPSWWLRKPQPFPYWSAGGSRTIAWYPWRWPPDRPGFRKSVQAGSGVNSLR